MIFELRHQLVTPPGSTSHLHALAAQVRGRFCFGIVIAREGLWAFWDKASKGKTYRLLPGIAKHPNIEGPCLFVERIITMDIRQLRQTSTQELEN